jgi:GT2 family glycosyltransferase
MFIDVIIPVYLGLDETRRCIKSVLSSVNEIGSEIIIINDASPDPELTRYLDSLPVTNKIRLVHNRENIGFVASVNLGMALNPSHDVVLLNSDTEVANNWLDRLNRAAHSSPSIGTATPFSNNATICSYPYEGWSGDLPGTLGLIKLDSLFAKTNPGITADLPTAVGFCMYIRRECLDQIGLFDEAQFGRGYGEENDFCLRATKAGWRNILAADTFVFHKGAVSFREERFELMKSAGAAILERYPDYMDRVLDFISRDPLAPLRERIDQTRTQVSDEETRYVLMEQANRAIGERHAPPAHPHTVCVIVTFNKPIETIDTNALLRQFGHIVLVDNTPTNHGSLQDFLRPNRITVIRNRNNGGLAGAYNVAIKQIETHHADTRYILFLDDDTDISSLSDFLISPTTHQALQQDDVAAVAPLYVERETGLPGTHIRMERFWYKVLPRNLNEPTTVTFLINSMSLWKLSVIRRIGAYNTDLIVDHIDTDYCLRAKTLGYKLILNSTIRFQHSIGMRRQYQFMCKTCNPVGTPLRAEK